MYFLTKILLFKRITEALGNFLAGNTVIKSLEVKFINPSELKNVDYKFLFKAVSLTSLSILHDQSRPSNHELLYEFIATHKTLTSFRFTAHNQMERPEFFDVYERIVIAMAHNTGLNDLTINAQFYNSYNFSNRDMSALLRRVSDITRRLEGRDVLINGVHVNRIIHDLQGSREMIGDLKALGLGFVHVGDLKRSFDGDL